MCEQACMPLEAAGLPGAHASGGKFGVEGGCLRGRGKYQPDWRAGMQAGAGMRKVPVPAPLPAMIRPSASVGSVPGTEGKAMAVTQLE